MESFEKLQNKMKELESETEHKGYYYKVSDALTIMICGMLCNLQNISDIHEWAKAEPVRDFLFKEFRIYKLPSRAQFYNLIGCVKSEQFQKVFMETEAAIRNKNMFTYPVYSVSLLRVNGKFEDEDFAKWACEASRKWNIFNFFTDSTVNSLSNCCRLRQLGVPPPI